MNAYDDLPPLSLAALGSPIWTIYSSKKPMRIQSCWSLCPQQVVLLQKLRVRSTFFSTTTRTALSIASYIWSTSLEPLNPETSELAAKSSVIPRSEKFFTLPLNLWIPMIHHRHKHSQSLAPLEPSHDTSQEEKQPTDRVCYIFITSTQRIGIAPNLNCQPGFGTRISWELHFIWHPNSNRSA